MEDNTVFYWACATLVIISILRQWDIVAAHITPVYIMMVNSYKYYIIY